MRTRWDVLRLIGILCDESGSVAMNRDRLRSCRTTYGCTGLFAIVRGCLEWCAVVHDASQGFGEVADNRGNLASTIVGKSVAKAQTLPVHPRTEIGGFWSRKQQLTGSERAPGFFRPVCGSFLVAHSSSGSIGINVDQYGSIRMNRHQSGLHDRPRGQVWKRSRNLRSNPSLTWSLAALDPNGLGYSPS